MDSNYEAQNQFVRQRLSARRKQAEMERMLRENGQERASGLRRFFMRLVRRPVQHSRRQSEGAQEAQTGRVRPT